MLKKKEKENEYCVEYQELQIVFFSDCWLQSGMFAKILKSH